MINDYNVMSMSRTRQRDFLRKAEAFRVAKQAMEARPVRPGLVERIRDALGTALILGGQRLIEHPALR